MNKKFLAIAVAAAVSAPMAASADAVLFGKLRLAVVGLDAGPNNYTKIDSNVSRIGVKGTEDLGGGLKAVYHAEFQLNVADQTGEFSGGTPLSSRNAFAGLAGNWGTLVIGRHDTPLKISTSKLDYFADVPGDPNYCVDGGTYCSTGGDDRRYTEAFTDRRANGTVAYITPSMGGLTIAAAAVPGENNMADGMADAYSIAAIFASGGLYASAAIEEADMNIDTLAGASDLTQTRFGLGYDAGSWKVAGTFENVELGQLGIDQDHYAVKAAFKFGNNVAKAKYFDVQRDHDGFAVGIDHNFSKRTQAYVTYVESNFDVGTDVSMWSIGLNHAF